jgi:general secretion pathway protein M
MSALSRFWSERAPRERAVLAVLAGVVALALLFLLLVEPAWLGIKRLQSSLPTLRAQVAQLDGLLAEAKALKSRPQAATVAPAEARAAIEKSLAGAGLKATRIAALADGDVQMTFAAVPFAQWSSWLAATERELGARAISVKATGTGTPGQVDVELALRLARR